MNILIISEAFSKGGLETHINTYYDELKKEHTLYFLFGRYSESKYLKGANITDGYNFSFGDSVKNFLEDVDKIITAIKENSIDVVHVHPFFSLYPTIFACNATNTKLVYTFHGRSSLNYFNTVNHSILYSFALENLFSKVFCVSKEVYNWLSDFKNDVIEYLPNIVDEKVYFESQIALNKKWALISRLDYDKSPEIIKLLKIIDDLDIEVLDIYGDGVARKDLEELAGKLNCRINFKGYCEDINQKVSEDYTGIIGLGRVALEGFAKNLPVLLIGYNKVIGVVDENIYNSIKNNNFVPGYLEDIKLCELQEQIKRINEGDYNSFRLRKPAIAEFGINLVDTYIKSIENSNIKYFPAIEKLLEDLRNPELAEESFNTSERVFNLLRQYLGAYTHSFPLKNSINLYGEIFNDRAEIYHLKNDISALEGTNALMREEISEFKNETAFLKEENTVLSRNLSELDLKYNQIASQQNKDIDFLKRSMVYVEKIGLITVIKRDLRKLKNKIFNK